ncbi:hypothetical protein L2E82_34216 [Cichorium intybus]|uniref:Uncharacterized protein n=1 Tax=Cichorium intybus TaxID=13427 RepID=A0ACB9BLS9_CICIN|nr:hypothetical protein L2E82_34216 [Cichorium intybus]
MFSYCTSFLDLIGENYITWFGWKPTVTMMDPDLIKDVFVKLNEFPKPRTHPMARFTATGLLTYEGDQWAKHRKLINPAFHMEKLKTMIPIFHLSGGEMLQKWEKLVSSKELCEVDVWPYLQTLTSDVISRTAFGSNYEEGIQIFDLIGKQGVLTMEALQSLYIPGFRFLPTKRNIRMNFIDKKVKHSIRDGLNHLKVVNMIFLEVLRLYPPVVGLARIVDKDITLGDFSLPTGIQIGLPIMLMHYDEKTWGSDAKKFNPDRFSEGISKATKNQVIYLPFGWGPRICVGQNFALLEAKIALAMILKRFSFKLSPSYVHAPHNVLTLQPQYGAHLILNKL